jgi:GMP synthase-like glutamine amidotransferase
MTLAPSPTAHITIVDPAITRPTLEGFNVLSQLSELPLTYHVPALYGFDSLKHDKTLRAGIVVLGSKSSVNDELPWQKELAAWLKPQLDKGIPTLGICFGHQFIARLFGSKVGQVPGLQVGFRKVSVSCNLLGKHQKEGEVFVAHEEMVLECPKEFSVIASNTHIPIEAMKHNSLPIWGMQSHPESTIPFCNRQGFTVDSPDRFSFGYQLLLSFFSHVASVTQTKRIK